ncbi:MAG: alpha amylase C-terminal domain-containing protein, partial [Waddliaceae bacterium]
MKGFAAGTSSEEKFANLRSALSFMMCQPGKKLLCMGTELGGSRGWDTYVGQTRGLFDNQNEISSEDRQTMKMLKALNEIYKSEKAFSEFDDNEHDLEWIEKNDPNKKVLAYRRTSSEGDSFACFHNFTSEEARTFKVRTMDNVSLEEIFSSDDRDFGGKGRKNTNIQIKSDEKGFYYEITIPPLSTVIIKETSAWEFDSNGDGFEWIKEQSSKKRAFAYRRKGPDGDRFACCYNLFSKQTKKLTVRTEEGNVLPQIVYSRSCKGLRKGKKETCKVEAGSDKKGEFYVVTLPPLSAVVLKEKKTKKK